MGIIKIAICDDEMIFAEKLKTARQSKSRAVERKKNAR